MQALLQTPTSLDQTVQDFNVVLPFSTPEPVPVPERPVIQPPPVNIDVGPTQPVVYNLIEGGSDQGTDLLYDSLGYKYTKRPDRVSVWRCSARGSTKCPATALRRGDVSFTNYCHHSEFSFQNLSIFGVI